MKELLEQTSTTFTSGKSPEVMKAAYFYHECPAEEIKKALDNGAALNAFVIGGCFTPLMLASLANKERL